MQVKFKQHTVKMTGRYKCECGYNFKRNVSDYWTENPFNKLFIEEGSNACDKRCLDNVRDNLKEVDCPKCGKKCENKDL